jgi:hypothetical protein
MISLGQYNAWSVSILSSGSFSPANIPGMLVWYDASQLVLANNDPVDTWFDVSGNGFNATKNSYSAPIYKTNQLNGKSVVSFTAASNQALRANYTQPVGSTEPWTVFVVGRLTGGSNARLLGSVYPVNQNWLLGWWNNFEKVAYYNGFVSDGGTGIAPTTIWRLFTGKGDGSVGYLYDKGVLYQSSSAGYSNMNGGIALSGYDPSGPQELSDGELAEIIIYNGALSDQQRMAVEAYLQIKYAL